VVDAHIRLFCRVGGVANAPVTAVVQLVIKHERQGQGGRSGPHAGLWYRALDGGGHELRRFRVDDDVPAEQHAADDARFAWGPGQRMFCAVGDP
jgi:hypothetical protein